MLAGIDAIGGFVQGGAAGSLTLDISSDDLTKTAGGSTAQTLTTFPDTVTPSGGTAPYTYSWARVSGSASITAASPSAATTTFSAHLNPEETVSAVFTCTVHDSSGAVETISVFVEISLVGYA